MDISSATALVALDLSKALAILSRKENLWSLFMDEVQLLKATEPLRENSLLLTTKFPGDPGTHLINLRRMKG